MNNKSKVKYKAFVLDIQILTHITRNVHPYIAPSLLRLTSLPVKALPNHSIALALKMLTQQPLPVHSTVQFESTYYIPPPEDNTFTDMNINIPHHQYQSTIIAPNLQHGEILPSITKFVDGGVNRHMYNAQPYFIKCLPYTGLKPSVTPGDVQTQCLVKGIGTIDRVIRSGDKIRLQNVIYVLTLNVSLFSIKQHMKYVGFYEHSENSICSIFFPSTIIQANNNEELDFSDRKPSSN